MVGHNHRNFCLNFRCFDAKWLLPKNEVIRFQWISCFWRYGIILSILGNIVSVRFLSLSIGVVLAFRLTVCIPGRFSSFFLSCPADHRPYWQPRFLWRFVRLGPDRLMLWTHACTLVAIVTTDLPYGGSISCQYRKISITGPVCAVLFKCFTYTRTHCSVCHYVFSARCDCFSAYDTPVTSVWNSSNSHIFVTLGTLLSK